jgi:hypothetical protein
MKAKIIVFVLFISFNTWSQEKNLNNASLEEINFKEARFVIKKPIDISKCEVEKVPYTRTTMDVNFATGDTNNKNESKFNKYMTNVYLYNGKTSCSPPTFEKFCKMRLSSYSKENLKVKPCSYSISNSKSPDLYIASQSEMLPDLKDGKCVDIIAVSCYENLFYKLTGDQLNYKSIKYQLGDYANIEGQVELKSSTVNIVEGDNKSNSNSSSPKPSNEGQAKSKAQQN